MPWGYCRTGNVRGSPHTRMKSSSTKSSSISRRSSVGVQARVAPFLDRVRRASSRPTRRQSLAAAESTRSLCAARLASLTRSLPHRRRFKQPALGAIPQCETGTSFHCWCVRGSSSSAVPEQRSQCLAQIARSRVGRWVSTTQVKSNQDFTEALYAAVPAPSEAAGRASRRGPPLAMGTTPSARARAPS
jgi:hypothetical protein